MRTRDSQRSKVYRAERAFWRTHKAWDNHTESQSELQAQVWAIWNDELVQSVFMSNREFAPKVNPKVVFKRKLRGAMAWDGLNKIAFSPTGNSPWVVVHEIAHLLHACLVGPNVRWKHAGHGPEFCAVYLRLTEICYGHEVREGLAAAFRAGRVKIANFESLR